MEQKAKEITAFFNNLKKASDFQGGKTVSRRTLMDYMIRSQLFTISHIGWWISGLQRIGWIESRKVYKNTKEYWFAKDREMYYKDLFPLFTQKAKQKKAQNDRRTLSEENCINYLKDLGYKVMKPARLSVTKLKAELGKDVFKFFEYEEL